MAENHGTLNEQMVDQKIKEYETRILKRTATFRREQSSLFPLRYFTLFLLVGLPQETSELLLRDIGRTVLDPYSYACLTVNDVSGVQRLADQIERVLADAARLCGSVEELINIFVVPIYMAGGNHQDIFRDTLCTAEEILNKDDKTPIWQSFLIYNRITTKNYPAVYWALDSVDTWIKTHKDQSHHRCCVLSTLDEAGFEIPLENLLHTICMTTVLLNTSPKAESRASETARAINMYVGDFTKNQEAHFFTSRCITVEPPIRSLILQRMFFMIDYFSGATDSSSKDAVGRMDYSFIEKSINDRYKLLPTYQDKITFLPFYGLMDNRSVDGSDLHRRLNCVLMERYKKPLYGKQAESELKKSLVDGFLREFFQCNGSIQELIDLTEEHLKIHPQGITPLIERLPQRKELQLFQYNQYKRVVDYCTGTLFPEYVGEVVALLKTVITSQDMKQKSVAAYNTLNDLKEKLQQRLQQMNKIECILPVGQTATADSFEKIQRSWVSNRASSGLEINGLNAQFDDLLCGILQGEKIDPCQLLEVCFRAVDCTQEERKHYMSKLASECTDPAKAEKVNKTIMDGWRYAIRLIREEAAPDVTCLIGDANNTFYEQLRKKLQAKVYSFEGYDCIEVLHLSAPFSYEKISGWEEIKDSWKGA